MKTTPQPQAHIAIIGGGWAGHAAAVTLVNKGCKVSLYESARVLGGRARAVTLFPAENFAPVTLDNGQHILLGAYTASLKMLRTVGVDVNSAFLRLPLQMCYPAGSGMHFETPRLPAPWHLAMGLMRATGLSRDDKMALARFSTTAKWMKWVLNTDCTVAELLVRYDQTERIVKLLWEPLCIAALNTPIYEASAQLFLNVLRDSLGARRGHSDMLIPRIDLSRCFPDAAAKWISAHGGEVHTGTTIDALLRTTSPNTPWALHDRQGTTLAHVDGIVIATPPEQAAQLLAPHQAVDDLQNFNYQPITTCYLQYSSDVQLDRPFYALAADKQQNHWGQFVFDRGVISQKDPTHTQAGLLAVVISTSSHAIAQGHTQLAEDVAAQLASVFQRNDLAHPLWAKIISEKRATFAATPNLARPENKTDTDRIVIAGDYTQSDYPATLETAIRSGKTAAESLLAQLAY
jgi:squalene-associated FAD-dependent desaturase